MTTMHSTNRPRPHPMARVPGRLVTGATLGALLALSAQSATARTLALRETLYHVELQSDYPPGRGAAFLDRRGRVLARVSAAFFRAAKIQGTAKLNDGRILNIVARKNGTWRWKVGRNTYGHGATCPMVPYRIAAVDPRLIPLGSVLFIPSTKGMRLPDGSRHDGLWYALDTGGAIRGKRIDLFSGAGKASMRPLTKKGIGYRKVLRVRVAGRVKGCPQD